MIFVISKNTTYKIAWQVEFDKVLREESLERTQFSFYGVYMLQLSCADRINYVNRSSKHAFCLIEWFFHGHKQSEHACCLRHPQNV